MLERTISDNFATVSASASAAPLASFLLVDLAISVGFVAYSLFSAPVLATLVALMVAKKVGHGTTVDDVYEAYPDIEKEVDDEIDKHEWAKDAV